MIGKHKIWHVGATWHWGAFGSLPPGHFHWIHTLCCSKLVHILHSVTAVVRAGCHNYFKSLIYRVSQEEYARLREGVPYVKVYRYNPKHLCPKLNGYGDNGQRKVWSSGGSTHCTCQLTSLIDVCPCVWCRIQLTLAVQLCSRLIPECEVSHVKSVLAMHVSCIVLGTLRTTMTCERVFL